MKKKLYIFLFLIVTQITFAQEDLRKFTFEFINANKKEIIQKIESTTTFKFYFDNSWFENETNFLNKKYNDASINSILSDVFLSTDFNFLILKNKIIITKNVVIYDSLPVDFFNDKRDSIVKIEIEKFDKPIFQQQNDSILSTKNSDQMTLIGKGNKNNYLKLFVITGFVKNSKTGLPEQNISIKIKNQNYSTVTDEKGFYSFSVPSGANILETSSFAHYKTSKKIVVLNDGNFNMIIKDKVSELDEVVVNAKKNKKVKEAISGVTSINIEGIKNVPLVLGERDIFRIATTLPGVKTTGEGSAGYNVRGGKEDQNLILMDNAVLYNPAHFFGFFSAVNPFSTKKADIYKGSIPVEFGGRLSSVFDITSKAGSKEKFKGEGGVGPVTSNLVLETPIIKNKSSLLVGGRATYSGWILRSLKEKNLKKSKAGFYDFIAKYSHDFNKNNTLESTFYYSNDEYSITSDSLFKYSNRIFTLKYDHRFNEKNKGSLIFTNSEYKFGIDYDSQLNKLNSFDFGYKINESQVMLKMNYNRSENHKFNYGISTKLYNINPGDFSAKSNLSLLKPVSIQSEKAIESAIFVSDSYKISEKLLIDYGLRYSFYSSLGKSNQNVYLNNAPLSDATITETKSFGNNQIIKTYSNFEPRIAARYFLLDDFSIKAGYDKTSQYINLLSSNSTQSPTDTWKLSDLNIKPQTAQQFSLGLFKNFNKSDLELSLEMYYKTSNNIIDYKVGAQLLLNKNIETQTIQGEGKAYGIELLLRKNEGRLNGWIGYSYSRSLIKFDGIFDEERINNGAYFSANFDKPHDFSAVLNYKLTKRYSLSANFAYQTGRPITYPIGAYSFGNAQYTLYSDRNKFRIPDYYRLDIGFNVEGSHKIKKLAHSFWNVSIYNVLGRSNPYAVYFITNNGKIEAYKSSIFAIPIPTITYNFKF